MTVQVLFLTYQCGAAQSSVRVLDVTCDWKVTGSSQSGPFLTSDHFLEQETLSTLLQVTYSSRNGLEHG